MNHPDYRKLITDAGIASCEEILNFFSIKIIELWVEMYYEESWLTGDITWQNFQGFTFGFDYSSNVEEAPTSSLPDSRVIGAFGISNMNVNQNNRKIMRNYLGASTKAYAHFGNNFDKGHFIAHLSGGPIDINLFPQRRDVNRGWSTEGKKYRAMEKHIAANPGTFVFSRPVYNDFSCCPAFIEYGYYDTKNIFDVEVFPNKNS